MQRNNLSKTVLLAACAAATVTVFAPSASAEPVEQCTQSGGATVCESPGSSSVTAGPGNAGAGSGGLGDPGGRGPAGANNQNGAYGPSGDTPPVGGE